ncbi:hypothetical protein [Pseudomonas saliphila]|uniref:hypothetical protein n=1 Tax=Pseudomonas saliphila TaxID=2586906 RepID=UPI00123BE29B|nr:hypothetical protein [Pseudomonas saliphila]
MAIASHLPPKTMINCRNLFLIILMLFALPLTGTADVQRADTRHATHQSGSTFDSAILKLENRTQECLTQGDGSVVCDTGLECQTSSLFQLARGKLALPMLSPLPLVSLQSQAPTRAPDSVWHPPRS